MRRSSIDFNLPVNLRAGAPEGQLYDLEADLGQAVNRFGEEPEVVAKLRAIREGSGTRPGWQVREP